MLAIHNAKCFKFRCFGVTRCEQGSGLEMMVELVNGVGKYAVVVVRVTPSSAFDRLAPYGIRSTEYITRTFNGDGGTYASIRWQTRLWHAAIASKFWHLVCAHSIQRPVSPYGETKREKQRDEEGRKEGKNALPCPVWRLTEPLGDNPRFLSNPTHKKPVYRYGVRSTTVVPSRPGSDR